MSTARSRCRGWALARRAAISRSWSATSIISTPVPGSGGDGQGYAVFGRVVEGMDVVRRILASPTSPTEGQGIMRGQML